MNNPSIGYETGDDGQRFEMNAAPGGWEVMMEQLAWVVQRRPEDTAAQPPRWIELEAASPQPAGKLSARELDVLELVATGRTDAEIADRLSISPRTVGAHISNMLNKTSASNRVELVIWAIANQVLMLALRNSMAPS